MKEVHCSCQGESHIESNKVCQDASYCEVNDLLSVAIVCDGHGGARYFRSDVGAQKAVAATRDCVEAFVKGTDTKIFSGKPYTSKLAITSEATTGQPSKDTIVDKVLRQLFSSIIYNWRKAIEEHVAETPLSEKERTEVERRYIEEFEKGEGLDKTYGCTLMCYVRTCTYWFAFHIGDGKCIAFDENGKWSEPIPWDEKCFLNKTTSLCDLSALDEFRYCYCGDGAFPMAVFLGSDGIDDSFGETENQVNFYVQILKLLESEGKEKADETISETLPQLSKIGSKDDMSIACIYDERCLRDGIKSLVLWQRENIGVQIRASNERIIKLQEEIQSFESLGLNSQKTMIDFQYAQKDLEKVFERKRLLVGRWDKIAKEINPENPEEYNDEIGLAEPDVDLGDVAQADADSADSVGDTEETLKEE